MTKELDEKLCADFPEIFKDRHGSEQETAMCWGFPGDGWEPIIRRCCERLMYIAKLEKVEPPVATQVKEKFGTLCFYADNTTDLMNLVIFQAERESKSACEMCEAGGKLRGEGWVRTLCDAHAK